jgi:hypothetical protein
MTAYFTWCVNRLAQVVPQIYYGQKPTKGQHGSDPVRILFCHELTEEDYKACHKDKRNENGYTSSLDVLAERYPKPELEEVT